jgi:GNAT superfamily N-acetyltransferase
MNDIVPAHGPAHARKKRDFELRYFGPSGYYYVSLADSEQRARVAARVKLFNEPLASVRHLWVSPDLRGAGIGKRFLGGICSNLDAIGMQCALYAHPYDRETGNTLDIEPLVKLYEGFGFQTVSTPKKGGWKGSPLMYRRPH